MIKEIQYAGMTAIPSDHDRPDGELALCFNLIKEGSALKAIDEPVKKFKISGGGRVIAIHKTSSSTNYIVLKTGVLGVLTEQLFWVSEQAASGEVSLTPLDADTIISGFRDVAIMGNTLIVADGLGLHYYLWQMGEYKDLGQRPPFIALEFGMMLSPSRTSEDITVPASVLASYSAIEWRHDSNDVSDEEMIEATNAVLGQVNKAIAEASQDGLFTMPFFVRYAYRLFDGTHYWASSPVLMLPITTSPILNAGTSSKAKVQQPKAFWLCYHALEGGLDSIKQWSDIIKGIDVFVSRPIYTFDASANIGEAGYRKKIHACITSSATLARRSLDDYYGAWADTASESSASRATDVGNVRPSRPGGSTSSGSLAGSDNITDDSGRFFIGAYSEYQNAPSAYSEKIQVLSTSDRVWNLKPKENFINDLLTVHDFYLYARLDIDNLNTGDNLYECDGLYGRDLTNLLTRPTLDDDFNSHARLIPQVLYSFNSRLHMGDITISAPTPMPIRAMKYCTGSCAFANGVNMAVFLRSGGEAYMATNTGRDDTKSNTFPDSSEDFPRFLYYPDAAAYRLRINIPSPATMTGRYMLPLTSHDFLNGSYWFGGLGLTAKPEKSTEADPELPFNLHRPNRVYYTETGNPFVMLPSNTATVGNGHVIGLTSASRPLSQGQFGQFPIYAFTDEGVWALEVSANGTIMSARPGPRDVSVSRQSIQQLDSSVAFISNQGIMMLSGLQVQCISDIIDNDCDITLNDIAPGLAGIDCATSLPIKIVPFKDYIKNGRLAYDYANRRLLCYNPQKSYSYVYSSGENIWTLIDRTFQHTVPSYPETMLMSTASDVLSLEQGTTTPHGMLLTRPLNLDCVDVLKTIGTMIQRGVFSHGAVRSILYGSRDLFSWHHVGSSTDHSLRGFRGTPYKFFRICLLCSLTKLDSISGATLQFTPRFTNRLR